MTYDFIVVGAGIAGASVAFELAQIARVCLIEGEDRPGIHTTGRSAALFAPSYGGKAIRALTRASRHFFECPPSGFCEYPLLQERGCLYISRSDQGDALNRMVDEIRASGGRVTSLTGKEANGYVSLLRPGYVSHAALDSDAKDIDVNGIHQGYLRGASAAGAKLLTGNSVKTARRRNGLWDISLGNNVVRAPILINAAGAWADEIATNCGAQPIGLQPLRRTALLIHPPGNVRIGRWPAVIDCEEEFYFKPEAGQLLLSPADETYDKPGDAQPEELDIAICVDRVEAVLDIEVKRINRSWAGLRTFAPDRVPVVGFDPSVTGLFWCAGQGGYGIQTSPAMARATAALAAERNWPSDIEREGVVADELSPHRFVELIAHAQES
jgi:D-arginine dehydrogenase